jgi:hypothetical protein
MRSEQEVRFLLQQLGDLAQDEQSALEKAENASDSTEATRANQQLLIYTDGIHILQWVLGEREAMVPVRWTGAKTA